MGSLAAKNPIISMARREQKAGARLPYLRHIDDATLIGRDGALMQFLHIEGLAFETAETEELNHRLAVRDTMLRSINNHQFTLYHHIVRRRADIALGGRFPDPVSAAVDRQWRAALNGRDLFVNDLFLTLVFRPKAGKRGLAARFSGGATSEKARLAQHLRALHGARENLSAALSGYGARLLERYDGAAGICSEPLEFLSLLYNGEMHPVLAPEEDLGGYIPYKRISFGIDALEQRGASSDGSRLGAILSIKDYPSITTPGVIDNLLRLPFELVVTESFRFVERQEAQERIDLAIRRLKSADDAAASLRRGLTEAKDNAASGLAGFGEHHFTALVRAHDRRGLDAAAAQAQAALADVGAIAVREDLNLEPAFWAQFPGNEQYIARRAMISTSNFAGLCSFHSFPIGAPTDNFWGEPVTVFETTAATPYFFDFHEGDLGNFVAIGPSGTGKTVLLNFLLAQSRKLGGNIYFFDKDRGAEIFLRAIGGSYDVLREGEPTRLNPLAMDDTPANRAFLRSWVAALLGAPSVPLSTAEQAVVADAVDSNFTQDTDFRRLRFFAELLGGVGPSRGDSLVSRLRPWFGEGEHAWLFDNPTDDISMAASVIGFDMTELLEAPILRGPAMMYLFHRIGQRLDGSRSIIVVDEGWKALDDDVFSLRLKDWLKTIRKRNGIVGFVTQSARDALDSRISATITEQTAVQLLLPNPRAQEEEYRRGFGLSNHEFKIVKSLPEHSRCVLIKKGGRSVVARLDLSATPAILALLAGRESAVRRLDHLRHELGDDPAAWLPALLGGREADLGLAGNAYAEAAE